MAAAAGGGRGHALSGVCRAAAAFELLDGSRLSLLTRQEVVASGGGGGAGGGAGAGRVVSYLFQRLAPAQWLTPDGVAGMVGRWQSRLVIASGWVPAPLAAALLAAGAKAVVAAGSWAAGMGPHAGGPQALADFFAVFYAQLAAGRSAARALEAAGAAVPELADAYAVWTAP